MRYELTDYEWAAIKPFLPNKPRGVPTRRLSASARRLHRAEQATVYRPITRRIDQQDSCGGRSQWPAGPARAYNW
jgi:hypothetical protein